MLRLLVAFLALAASLTPLNLAAAATLMIRAQDARVGAVVHIGSYGSPTREIAALKAIGVTRVRVDSPQPVTVGAGNGYDALCAAGIRITPFLNGWIDPANDTSPNAEFAATKALEQRHPGCVEFIEGPNEVNNFPENYHGLTGTAGAQAFQTALYARVKADPVLGHVPVIGYTDSNPVDSPSDYLNNHPYANNWWQDVTNAYVGPLMTKANPSKPWGATEYGWTTPPTQTDRTVTEAVMAQRIPTGVAAMLLWGFNPAFIYELRDEGTSATDGSQHYGLFRADWTPKEAANRLGRLMTQLADPQAPAGFTPAPLAVTCSDPLVHTLVVAKSDGSYRLLFWTTTAEVLPSRRISFTLSRALKIGAYRLRDGSAITWGRASQFGWTYLDGSDLAASGLQIAVLTP